MSGIKAMNRIMGVLLAITVLLVATAIGGCSANHAVGEVTQHPGVRAKKGLFSAEVSMTSDGSASIGSASYNAKDNTLTIANFNINQKSSDAAKYDAAKIEKIGQAQLWQVQWVQASWYGLTNTLHELAPMLQLLAASKFIPTDSGFNIEVPGYFNVGQKKVTDPAQMQSLLQSLATSVSELRKTTTQPANKEEE